LFGFPKAVRSELTQVPTAEAEAAIAEAFSDGWLRSCAVQNSQLAAALTHDLDIGEAESIALATEIAPEV